MKARKFVLLVLALALIAGGAGFLMQFRAHQRLSPPAVKTRPAADPKRLEVLLPETVLDYTSEAIQVDDITLATLPQDTSYGQRRYMASDKFWLNLNVVLMGTDRTSLHKPQFCLAGQGFQVDAAASEQTSVRVEKPEPYDLPVVKLIATRQADIDGQRTTIRAVYVYWYVADGAVSASTTGFQRMWLMARDMLRTGVLKRWAYVSCMAVCLPGQEQATFERLKKFIPAAVPEFQTWRPQQPVRATAALPATASTP